MRTAVAVLLAAALTAQAPPVESLVLRHVTVVDVVAGTSVADQTVVIEQGRITAVATGDMAVAGSPREVDGKGRFLIPGLQDLHVHMTAMTGFAELFVANGVTGVRDMFSVPQQVAALRQAIERGERTGPRVAMAGRIVDGEPPTWPGSLVATDAATAQQAVATALAQGSEFIKVYSRLPRAAYFAIVAACKQRGVPFAGHVPVAVTAMEAVVAGQRSIEHLTGLLEACSADDERARDPTIPKAERQALLAAPFAADKARELAALCRQHGTWLCPTLTVLRAIAHLDDAQFVADERLRYVQPFLARMWLPANDRRFQAMTPADWALQKQVFAQQRALTQALIAAGAPLLAGTDTGNPFCFPGFSLHDELRLLVELGMTPAQALRAATHDAAVFLGREAELGTVAEGLLADLVLLDADPLQDIANTTRIAAVIAAGRYHDRERLDALLDRAAAGNK